MRMAANSLRIALTALAAVLVLAVPAFADESTTQGYGGVAGSVQTQVGQQPGSAGQPSAGNAASPGPVRTLTPTQGGNAGGNLPFTGADLGMLVAGGLVLLAGGLALRRLSSDRSS
jgi:hypothetical protein